MNTGVAEEFCKLAEMEIAGLYTHSHACSALFILTLRLLSSLSCSGWCGETHTLPYATDTYNSYYAFNTYTFKLDMCKLLYLSISSLVPLSLSPSLYIALPAFRDPWLSVCPSLSLSLSLSLSPPLSLSFSLSL